MILERCLPAPIRALVTTRTLRPGQTLFKARGRAADLYEVISGRLRLVRHDSFGRLETLSIATPGDKLGQASLCSEHYNCDAIAITSATVRRYPKAAVLAELERNPKLARAIIAMLGREVMSLRTRLHLQNIHNARDRVRTYLSLNAGTDGRTVSLAGTVKDLATYLGLTHEALYRTLAAMTADGEIKRSVGKIQLSTGFDKWCHPPTEMQAPVNS
jgi:CRP/FNR family transcriptional regulator, dissimilatory nitrate respiration regulator